MLLKADSIAELLRKGAPESDTQDPLVISPQPNLSDLEKSGAASIDLRLGCWFSVLRQTRSPLLQVSAAADFSETALTKTHYVRFGDNFVLHPRSFVLGVTLEWLRLPHGIGGYVTSRSSWGRRGLIIATATGVHPGFSGCLTLELSNVGEIPIALSPGMAVCQFFMHDVRPGSENIDSTPLAGKRKPALGKIGVDKIAAAIAKE